MAGCGAQYAAGNFKRELKAPKVLTRAEQIIKDRQFVFKRKVRQE